MFSLQQHLVCQIIYMFMWESIRSERLTKPINPRYKKAVILIPPLPINV